MSRLAIGLRQSTWVARPAGAMSRFVLLQTPPSTYSRPPICTGAKIHGTEQDACTASATLASGAPGAPNTTRRPLARSTATTRRRPSKRAPALSTRSRIAVSDVSRPGARPSSAARSAVLPFAPAASAIGASGVAAAPARRTASRATLCRIVRGSGSHCAASRVELSDATSPLVSPGGSSRPRGRRPRPARALAGHERGRDERSRRRPDDATRWRGSRARWRPRCRPACRSSRPRRACRRWRARARRGAGRGRRPRAFSVPPAVSARRCASPRSRRP